MLEARSRRKSPSLVPRTNQSKELAFLSANEIQVKEIAAIRNLNENLLCRRLGEIVLGTAQSS
jgi:hypothetical protein